MSKIEVNTVAPQCGTTLTLGESGDTVTLGTGASQSGFGRTGTVDWVTTPKTSTFTAVSGNGYFINSGSSLTCNLPAGTAGDIVAISDYARNFNTYNFIISPNGSEKIGGVADDITLNINGQALTLVYVDSTKGWINIQNAEDTETGVAPAFVAATGGNSTATAPCGDYKIHTFTGPGTFCVSNAGNAAGSNQLEYIIVGGAGAGGGQYLAGGGGAGGFRFAAPSLAPLTYPAKPLAAPAGITATATGYPIVIGGGGTGNSSGGSTDSTPGVNTTALGLTAAGGGAGKQDQPGNLPTARGQPGGSGGGGSVGNPSGNLVYQAGAGNTPPVSPSQGNPGGAGNQTSAPGSANICGTNWASGSPYVAGGGGGATARGGCGVRNPGSAGTVGVGGAGAGVPALFGTSGQNCGTNYYFAGGGGGAGTTCTYTTPPGAGGLGGGGAGNANANGTAGTVNTGGGGGGTDGRASPGGGGGGGSGIVIIRYKFQ